MLPAKPAKPSPDAGSIGVETLRHPADVTRRNIPTAETSGLMADAEAQAPPMRYPRNLDLDPQLVWRGKDAQDGEDLQVPTVPIYIQEKVLPEALIRDLQRQTRQGVAPQADLFGGFDRIADPEAKLEFYGHAENWSNRMILGDSLLVMNSLAGKEGLRGQVQMIYLDPPYGIKFGSNWQPSTRTRDAKEGKIEGVSRQPEQVKAFRDTWKDGIHSYLSYLRDRLMVGRDLLTECGSVFVQIGDENVHRVRAVMDEVLGPENYAAQIVFKKTSSLGADVIGQTHDFLLWYARDKEKLKTQTIFKMRTMADDIGERYRRVQLPDGIRGSTSDLGIDPFSPPSGAIIYSHGDLTSQSGTANSQFSVEYQDMQFSSGRRYWTHTAEGIARLQKAERIGSV